MGKLIERGLECPNCSSSDAYSIWEREDNSQQGYCFSCAKYSPVSNSHRQSSGDSESSKTIVRYSMLDTDQILENPFRALQDRAIKDVTCEHANHPSVRPRDAESALARLVDRARQAGVIE